MPPRKRANDLEADMDSTEVRYLQPGDAVRMLPEGGEAIYLGPGRKSDTARLRVGTAHEAPLVVPFYRLDYVEPQDATSLHWKFRKDAEKRGEI